MQLPNFLTEAPFGEIRLTGHRIGLFHVIEDYQAGMSPERLCEEYPTLSLELINRVIAFYREHREEVDAYMARCQAEIERHEATLPSLDVAGLKRRMPEVGRTGSA